jgi:hypothetical protein
MSESLEAALAPLDAGAAVAAGPVTQTGPVGFDTRSTGTVGVQRSRPPVPSPPPQADQEGANQP